MGKIITTLTIEKRNHDGKILESFTRPSRSWTKHFFDLLYEPLGYQLNTQAAINDVTPAARALSSGSSSMVYNLFCGAPAGKINSIFIGPTNSTIQGTVIGGDYGIVVGSGAGGPATTDDKLATKILHGETAGTLLYGGTELYGLTFANPNGQFSIRRYFTNVLGGVIAVTESAIYAVGAGLPSVFCILRDVFGAVNINNGQILSAVYTVQITV